MTNAAAPSLPMAFPDLYHELNVTRKLLRRIPDEQWNWKPHEKSMTLGRMATHLAEVVFLAATVLSHDGVDVNVDRWPTGAPATRDELIAAYEAAIVAVTQAVAAVPADGWSKGWTVRSGGRTLLCMPRDAVFRSMGINHLVHHRAQLTVYLRLLGIPVPALYGPSADEDGPPM